MKNTSNWSNVGIFKKVIQISAVNNMKNIGNNEEMEFKLCLLNLLSKKYIIISVSIIQKTISIVISFISAPSSQEIGI